MKITSSTTQPIPGSPTAEDFDCPICRDVEFLIEGWQARPCICRAQKELHRRMQSALIPEEFEQARLDNYRQQTETQKRLYQAATLYLESFPDLEESVNGLGFVATLGEHRIKQMRNPEQRMRLAKKHNSYGLGKTHLQVAIAKELIQQGIPVLIVSDVTLMEDLAQARTTNDGGEAFRKRMDAVIDATVLIWDDLGKSPISDFNHRMYYRIINERYKAKRPILYSSNEDESTLEEKIGTAAVSRLFGSSRWIVPVEGRDYRQPEE